MPYSPSRSRLRARSPLPQTLRPPTVQQPLATDYLSTSGVLTFNPGDLTKTITVTVNGDNAPEVHEVFLVNLSSPTNAFLSDSQGVGTILSDDAPGGAICLQYVAEHRR